jgi:hypothetical protein
VISILDSAFLLSSTTEMHFLISNPMAAPIGGGTALPICNIRNALLLITFNSQWIYQSVAKNIKIGDKM